LRMASHSASTVEMISSTTSRRLISRTISVLNRAGNVRPSPVRTRAYSRQSAFENHGGNPATTGIASGGKGARRRSPLGGRQLGEPANRRRSNDSPSVRSDLDGPPLLISNVEADATALFGDADVH
jgi:hypothetical protein